MTDGPSVLCLCGSVWPAGLWIRDSLIPSFRRGCKPPSNSRSMVLEMLTAQGKIARCVGCALGWRATLGSNGSPWRL